MAFKGTNEIINNRSPIKPCVRECVRYINKFKNLYIYIVFRIPILLLFA